MDVERNQLKMYIFPSISFPFGLLLFCSGLLPFLAGQGSPVRDELLHPTGGARGAGTVLQTGTGEYLIHIIN